MGTLWLYLESSSQVLQALFLKFNYFKVVSIGYSLA